MERLKLSIEMKIEGWEIEPVNLILPTAFNNLTYFPTSYSTFFLLSPHSSPFTPLFRLDLCGHLRLSGSQSLIGCPHLQPCENLEQPGPIVGTGILPVLQQQFS